MAVQIKNKVLFDEFRKKYDHIESAELINGEIIIPPSPSSLHQKISRNINGYLFMNLLKIRRKEGLFNAPIDVKFDNENVLQPDILYIEDISKIKKNYIVGPPDLIIEIISPSSRVSDLITKKSIYLGAGVKEYWIVDSDKEEVIVYLNNIGKIYDEDSKIKSDILGFEIPVRFIFD